MAERHARDCPCARFRRPLARSPSPSSWCSGPQEWRRRRRRIRRPTRRTASASREFLRQLPRPGQTVPSVDLEHGQFRRASSDAQLIDIIRRGIPGTAMPRQPIRTPPRRDRRVPPTQAMSKQPPLAASAARQGAVRGQGPVPDIQRQWQGIRLGIDISDVGRIRRSAEPRKRCSIPHRPCVRRTGRSGSLTRRRPVTGRLLNHDMLTGQLLTRASSCGRCQGGLREFTVVETSPKTSYAVG